MKKFSPFQITILAVFGGLGVAGILIFALSNTGNTGSAVGPVQIWGTLDAKSFNLFLETAKQTDENLANVTYVQKDTATYADDLTNAIANGGGPDLFILRHDYALRDAGKISPVPPPQLSPSQFQNTFIDAATPFFYSASGALGIPFLADPLVLYWNRDLLSSAGFVKPPQYWEELSEYAQKITKKNDTGSILRSGIAFGEYSNIFNAKDILATLILQAGGKITTQDNKGEFVAALAADAGVASQSTESAVRFYTQFADPANNVSYSWNQSLPEAEQAFASGELALYVGHVSEYPAIVQKNPNLRFAVAPLPQIKTASRLVNTARVYAFAVSRTSDNPVGAQTVAGLLASPQNARELSSTFRMPSTLRELLAQKAEGDEDVFNKQAIISHSWLDPDPQKTDDIFRAMIERVTSGSLRLDEAVRQADNELEQLTDRYNQ